MRKLSFPQLAFAVISRFVSEEDVPHQDLKDIIDRSYSTFRSPGGFAQHAATAPWGSGGRESEGGRWRVICIHVHTDLHPCRQHIDTDRGVPREAAGGRLGAGALPRPHFRIQGLSWFGLIWLCLMAPLV